METSPALREPGGEWWPRLMPEIHSPPSAKTRTRGTIRIHTQYLFICRHFEQTGHGPWADLCLDSSKRCFCRSTQRRAGDLRRRHHKNTPPHSGTRRSHSVSSPLRRYGGPNVAKVAKPTPDLRDPKTAIPVLPARGPKYSKRCKAKGTTPSRAPNTAAVLQPIAAFVTSNTAFCHQTHHLSNCPMHNPFGALPSCENQPTLRPLLFHLPQSLLRALSRSLAQHSLGDTTAAAIRIPVKLVTRM